MDVGYFMKKRVMWIFFIIFGLISINYVFAECGGIDQPPCVCGQEPNSTIGYGQVIIDSQYFSCSNIQDYVCPEDFQDAAIPEIVGNCSSCIDPDCIGTATGVVKNTEGATVPRAKITTHPLKYEESAPTLETSTESLQDGTYSFNAPTGTYYFSASASGYDTQLIEATINRYSVSSGINFVLANGTCHDDCTNYYGRCSKECEGTTSSNTSGGSIDKCEFYNVYIASLCNNKLAGVSAFIGKTYSDGEITYTAGDNKAWFVDCCEGEPYTKYYANAGVTLNQLDNLIKVTKLVKYEDRPVTIIVALWNPVN